MKNALLIVIVFLATYYLVRWDLAHYPLGWINWNG